MAYRKLLVGLLTAGLLLLGTGTAQAWDLIHDRHGYGQVTLRAWTKNYNQVAYVADHAGTKVNVQVTVSCASGYTFSHSWTDDGERFRYILGGLGNDRRCDHTFKVQAKKTWVKLELYLFARG